jgi:hypothetical protein
MQKQNSYIFCSQFLLKSGNDRILSLNGVNSQLNMKSITNHLLNLISNK